MNTCIRRLAARRARLGSSILLGLLVLALAGCTRNFYRRQADREVYGVIGSAADDSRWVLEDYTIQPDPRSRMYDPCDPDFPPMPPDDPTSHRLMETVDGKRNARWRRYGRNGPVENPGWMAYLPYDDEKKAVVLDRDAAVQLALLHSREYQRELEDLYLSALDVTFQRFRFDAQFFGSNSTLFSVEGPLSGIAAPSSTLTTATSAEMQRLFATGSQLVTEAANSVVWQFAGDNGHVATTPLTFSLLQPLLRGAGRAVVLEELTDTERALLANVRQLERFRRGFYVEIVAGGDPGPGPSPGGIGLGGVSPGRAAGVGGYLALLRQQLEIRNQRDNVAALGSSLERLDAFLKAGRISRVQVDQLRQALYDSQVSLLDQITDYRNGLDGYKITLGLPPQLTVDVEDEMLEPYVLLEPTLTQTRNEVDELLGPVRELWSRVADADDAATAAAQALRAADESRQAADRAAAAMGAGNQPQATEALDEAVEAAVRSARAAANGARALRSGETLGLAEAAAKAAETAGEAEGAEKLAALRRVEPALVEAANQLTAAAEAAKAAVLPVAPVALAKAYDGLAPIRPQIQALLTSAQHDCAALRKALPERRRHLEYLSRREEFRRGDVDLRIVDVGALDRRVVAVNVALYGKNDLSVRQLVDELLRGEADRQWFDRLSDVEGLVSEVPATLDKLDQLRGWHAAGQDVGDDLKAWRELLGQTRKLLGRLSNRLLGLSLAQARARLDIPTLTLAELESSEAVEIARANRRDWMNARAALVDQWRRIEVVANTLKSALDITFSGDLTTRSDTLNVVHNTTGSLQLGLEFDAPLTRLEERNAYREALISYQQGRRQYYAFEDRVAQTLRDIIRTIELAELQFELQRAAVHLAIGRVELEELKLQERRPKADEAVLEFGPTAARDLVDALGALLRAQNDFLGFGFAHEALRLSLDFNLGTMQLDDRGMWINPGPIRGDRAAGGAPLEVVPSGKDAEPAAEPVPEPAPLPEE